MILSRACQHALRAILLMAAQSPKAYIDARELSGTLEIPFHVLAKIFQGLARRGILHSHRGPKGGFALVKAPSEIRLIDIVEAIDGLQHLDTCLLGMPECSDATPCPAHNDWKPVREQLHAILASQSVEDLARGMQGNLTTVIPNRILTHT